MKQKTIYLFLATVLGLLVASCGVKRTATTASVEEASRPTLGRRAFFQALEARTLPPIVDAKGDIELDSGKSRVKGAVRYSLVRDSAFVLSARLLGLMEVARITVDEERLLVLDRVGKRAFYAEDATLLYGTIEGLTGDSPMVLKYIVQQQPFTLQGRGVEQMKFSKTEQHYKLEERDRRSGAVVTHLFSPQLTLIESRVMVPGVVELLVNYSEYVHLPQPLHSAPVAQHTTILLRLLRESEVQSMRLSLVLKEPTGQLSQKIDTTLPNGYHRLTVKELVQMVRNL